MANDSATALEEGQAAALERLHRAAIRLLRALRNADEESGLSGPRLSALSVVAFSGPVTLGELARRERVRPPTMSRLIDALVQLDLVVRSADANDGRITWLQASIRGRRLMNAARRRRHQALERAAEALGPRDRARLSASADTLAHLAAALEDT